MQAKAAALGLALLLLAPCVGATWDQYRGEAQRTRGVVLADGPVDVLGTLTILAENEGLSTFNSPGAVERADGTLVSLAPVCEIVIWTPQEGVLSRDAPADCGFGNLLGVDSARDQIVLCTETASGPFIRAFAATTLDEVWALEASAFAPVGPSTWACNSGAYDPELDVWYFLAGSYLAGNPAGLVVGAVDGASGELVWSTRLGTTSTSNTIGAGALPADLSAPEPLFPRSLTLTQTGIIVTLYASVCALCAPRVEEGAIAWLTRDGLLNGMFRAATDGRSGGDVTRTPTISESAVARGPIATLVLGGQVALVNPESGIASIAPLEGLEPATNYLFWRPPVWADDVIVYPQLYGLVAYSSALEFKWAWTGGEGHFTADIVPTSHGSLLVLQGREEDAARLIELDLADGTERGSWAIPITPPTAGGNDEDWDAQFVATQGGELLAIDPAGQVVRLGSTPASARPRADPSTLYPGVSESVTFALEHPNATSWRVHWGDGSIESRAADGAPFSHAWGRTGDRVVRVSATLADGSTASREIVIHVGGVAPPQLTAIQKAFSPQYQNWTFFILGLLVTIIGVAFTVGRQRRRFNRLERELAAVEEIRMMSVSDPRAAVLALKSYRDHLPDDLAHRRVDDSQYQILDIRSARLLKVLRTRLFAPFDPRLSVRYHRLLDAAFEDAILQPSERLALVASLEGEEALRSEDRPLIVAILDDFTSGRLDINNA